MADSDYAVDDSGLLVPPHFDDGTISAPVGTIGAHAAPMVPARSELLPSAKSSVITPATALPPRAGLPSRRAAVAPVALAPAGRLNWIYGVLGIITGLASFVWPLVCLTVLVGLALSAVGASRAARLRHRGATGRGIAIVGVVIGLASAANLVFGISQMLQLGSQVNHLLP